MVEQQEDTGPSTLGTPVQLPLDLWPCWRSRLQRPRKTPTSINPWNRSLLFSLMPSIIKNYLSSGFWGHTALQCRPTCASPKTTYDNIGLNLLVPEVLWQKNVSSIFRKFRRLEIQRGETGTEPSCTAMFPLPIRHFVFVMATWGLPWQRSENSTGGCYREDYSFPWDADWLFSKHLQLSSWWENYFDTCTYMHIYRAA